jgi:hypothetical protein
MNTGASRTRNCIFICFSVFIRVYLWLITQPLGIEVQL